MVASPFPSEGLCVQFGEVSHGNCGKEEIGFLLTLCFGDMVLSG